MAGWATISHLAGRTAPASNRTRDTMKRPPQKIAARKGAPLPFEIHATRDQPLGMPIERFLRNYWHKHPLLIRNAFAEFSPRCSPKTWPAWPAKTACWHA